MKEAIGYNAEPDWEATYREKEQETYKLREKLAQQEIIIDLLADKVRSLKADNSIKQYEINTLKEEKRNGSK